MKHVVVLVFLLGCGLTKPFAAGSAELADYQAFRMAAHPGARLSAAQAYLERYPKGVWEKEVRVTFDAEEAVYFEVAQRSRGKTLEYLVALPRGPSAAAAFAMLMLFDANQEDPQTSSMLRAAKRTEEALERATEGRRQVGDRVFAALSAFLEPGVFGKGLKELPVALRGLLTDRKGLGRGRVVRVPYGLPGPRGVVPRTAEIEVLVVVDNGLVIAAAVQGPELFTRWAEADAGKVLEGGRKEAALHLVDALAGALEGQLPAARCAKRPGPGELLVRRCDGMSVVATMGARGGDTDGIVVSGRGR
ncbi:MAG: hypothetical protein WCI05_12535 [Myxococcales bacterium]